MTDTNVDTKQEPNDETDDADNKDEDGKTQEHQTDRGRYWTIKDKLGPAMLLLHD